MMLVSSGRRELTGVNPEHAAREYATKLRGILPPTPMLCARELAVCDRSSNKNLSRDRTFVERGIFELVGTLFIGGTSHVFPQR